MNMLLRRVLEDKVEGDAVEALDTLKSNFSPRKQTEIKTVIRKMVRSMKDSDPSNAGKSNSKARRALRDIINRKVLEAKTVTVEEPKPSSDIVVPKPIALAEPNFPEAQADDACDYDDVSSFRMPSVEDPLAQLPI